MGTPFTSVESTDLGDGELLTPVDKAYSDAFQHVYYKTPNDMSVYFSEDPLTPSHYVTLLVQGGFADGPAFLPGVMHLLEHLICDQEGKSDKSGDFFTFVNTNGGTVNAETCANYTLYHFNVLNDAFPHALKLFMGLFAPPLPTEFNTYNEIGIIEKEYLRNIPNEAERVLQLLRTLMNSRSRYRIFGRGNAATLEKSSLLPAIRQAFRRFFKWGNMKLSIYGNSNEESHKLVQEISSSVHIAQGTTPRAETEPPYTAKELGKLVKWKTLTTGCRLEIFTPLSRNLITSPSHPYILMRYLIGNPEPGSFVHELQKRQWGIQVTVGYIEICQEYVWYNVTVTLTNVDVHLQVLRLFFDYMAYILENFKEHHYVEESNQHSIAFHFENLLAPGLFTQEVVKNAQFYPPKQVLTGPSTFKSFSKAELQGFLRQIRADNVLVLLGSSSFNSLKHKEPFYNTSYEDMDLVLPATYSPPAVFSLPAPLPKQNTVEQLKALIRTIDPQNLNPFPEPIDIVSIEYNYTASNFWYADENFPAPNYSTSLFIIPDASALNTGLAKSNFHILYQMFEEQMIPVQRKIERINVHINSQKAPIGLRINLEGIAPSATTAAEMLAEFLKAFRLTQLTADKFKTYRDNLIANSVNTEHVALSEHVENTWRALAFQGGILPTPPHDKITFKAFTDYFHLFFSKIYIEVLTTGAINRASATTVFDSLFKALLPHSKFIYKAEDIITPPETRLYDMSTPAALILPLSQTATKTSCLSLYIYIGNDIDAQAFGGLVESSISLAFFSRFRRKEKRGYVAAVNKLLEQGHSLLHFVLETADGLSVELLKNLSLFFIEEETRISTMTSANFEKLKEVVKSEHEGQSSSFFEQHELLTEEMLKHGQDFQEQSRLVSAIDAFSLSKFQKMSKDKLRGQKESLLILFSQPPSLRAVTEKMRPYFKDLEVSFFTSPDEYHLKRQVYPDLWSLAPRMKRTEDAKIPVSAAF